MRYEREGDEVLNMYLGTYFADFFHMIRKHVTTRSVSEDLTCCVFVIGLVRNGGCKC